MGITSNKPLRIGFLSDHNAFDRNAFSGTVFYMRQALERLGDVHVLGGHKPIKPGTMAKIGRKLRGKRALKITSSSLDDLDVIIAPVATALILRSLDQISVPVIAITDATPKFLEDFYGKDVPQAAHTAEARMIDAVDRIVYSSHFMADLARTEFADVIGSKTDVVPFGVNLDTIPAEIPQKPNLDRLELLFIGQDWERKGGDIAIETLDILRKRGVSAQLTTIGASGAEGHDGVASLGYLNKNDPGEMSVFSEALRKAHLLIFPTRADCTPMVIAEANAYGCPVLVTQTGGIGSLVSNEVNGQMLPYEAQAAEYADAVQEICKSSDHYLGLSRSSFDYCRTHLTWDAWANAMQDVIERTLAKTLEKSYN